MKKALNHAAPVKKVAKPKIEITWDKFKLGLEVAKVLLALHGLR